MLFRSEIVHRNGLPIKRRIIAAGLAAVGLMAGTGGVHGEPAPLAAVDLAAAEKGVLLDAELSPRPAAGRYRLVLPLALKPLRDPAIGNLAVSVEAGGSRAVFQRWEFEAPARMQEFAVEFVADGDVPPRLRVNWEIDAAARLYRVKATPLPRTPAETAVAGAAEDTEIGRAHV